MTMRNTGRAAARGALLAALVVVGACGSKSQAAAGPADVRAGSGPAVELGASAQLDSGNVAFRAKDYAAALKHYRTVAAREPSPAAGWFGIYMAQNALGDSAAADSAMKKVQELAPGTMSSHPTGATLPGAATAHGATGAHGGALPAGHPVIPATPGR